MNNVTFRGMPAGLMIFFLVGVFFSKVVHAAECSAVFPTAAASSSNAGSVTIGFGANIRNSPGNSVVTRHLSQSFGCGLFLSCNQVNAVSAQAANFTSFPGNTNVSVGWFQTRNLTPGNYNSITTSSLSTINFAPGDYTVAGELDLGSNSTINVSAAGTVRLFVQGRVTFGGFSSVNASGSGRYLYIYTRNSFSMVSYSGARAVVYAKGRVDIGNSAELTGAVTSEADITIQNGASLYYNESIVNSTNFGASCGVVIPAVNSFYIDTGGSGASTCTPKNITITARDANNNTLTGHTGTISLTTSTGRGTWAKTHIPANANGPLVAGADNGQATYTFTAADAGNIVLALNNPRAQSLTVSVEDSGAGIGGVSPPIHFSDNVFVIEPTNTWGADIIAMRDHPFTATMMRRDPDTGNCGPATAYNVANLRMWLTRDGDDPGGAAPQVASTSLPNSQPANNNINLSFSNGVAAFSLRTTDVGKYAINLADTSESFASTTISADSSTVVARPFGIHVAVSGNPAATQASGPRFRAAGQPFTVTVRAVGWQSADDSNNDGIPDNHNDADPANNANLADNLSLVSFSKAIALSSKLISPSGGSESGLSGGSFATFSAGAASSADIRFNDVGIIEIGAQISDGDYLGSPGSDKIMGKSGYVGRFYPDHFRLSNTAVQSSCSAVLPYSYLDEPFAVSATITPYSASGTALQNYRDGFIKLDTNRFPEMLSAVEEAAPQLLSNRIAVVSDHTAYQWNAGVLTAAPNIQINRAASPDGPFPQVRIGLKPFDSDGVTLRAADLNLDLTGDGSADTARLHNTSKSLRYGRLRLDDSYGPETANLPVVFRSEYWDGSEWKQNRDDSCTQIALTDIAYPDGPISVIANRSPPVGGGSTTGIYANLSTTSVGFTEGDAGHYFTAPGAGNIGTVRVQIDLTRYPWLRFDWNQDGDFTDSSLPDAHFTFGNYRGHDRVLYWIEAGGY